MKTIEKLRKAMIDQIIHNLIEKLTYKRSLYGLVEDLHTPRGRLMKMSFTKLAYCYFIYVVIYKKPV